MRYTLSEARSSPVAMTIFLLGAAAFLFAVVAGPELGSFGAETGTPMWWLGVGFAGLAVVLGIRSWLRAE